MKFDDQEVPLALAEARDALATKMAPTQVVTRAGTMLRMAQQGFRDMGDTDEDRILFGFLGVVVFGRSMTFVMQNLRTYDEKAFDDWYIPWQDEMKGDPLMLYFYDLRTKVIHKNVPMISILLGGFGDNMRPIGSISVEGMPAPDRHLGVLLDDTSIRNLCRLYIVYLERMFKSFAPVAFAVHDRLNVL